MSSVVVRAVKGSPRTKKQTTAYLLGDLGRITTSHRTSISSFENGNDWK